jgi:hypothetical protein
MVRAGWAAAVAILVCGAATACGAAPTLYGVERVNSCLVLNGAEINDQGKGYVWVNGEAVVSAAPAAICGSS